jgi:hypothetical protein
MEGSILSRAAGVSFVNEDMQRNNELVFGKQPGQTQVVIPNGFDSTDVIDASPIVPLRPTLMYAGSCYGSRSMAPIIEALQAEFGSGHDGLQLRVFGELDSGARALLDADPIEGRIQQEGRIPAEQLSGHLRGADALLLIIGEDHHSALSAKVFDYMQSERPIVGYGPEDCAAAQLLRQCGLGMWAHDGPSLRRALRAVAQRKVPRKPRPTEIARYSADVMAESTATLLDEVVEVEVERRRDAERAQAARNQSSSYSGP